MGKKPRKNKRKGKMAFHSALIRLISLRSSSLASVLELTTILRCKRLSGQVKTKCLPFLGILL